MARLLNQEHEDPDIMRYHLYVFRRRACRRLERLGLAVRDDWEVERALPRAYFDPLAIDLF